MRKVSLLKGNHEIFTVIIELKLLINLVNFIIIFESTKMLIEHFLVRTNKTLFICTSDSFCLDGFCPDGNLPNKGYSNLRKFK